jgi:hypothetical protein
LVSQARHDSYEQIAAKAHLVRQIFAQRGINIRRGSALEQVLSKADLLSQAWNTGAESPGANVLCEAAFVNRLADAITALPDEAGLKEALKRMAGSIMQPDDRQASQGKDAVWEVVLLADLKVRGMKAIAAEPDILVNFGIGDYPIACKKVWSEDNVEKQISKGGKQLRPFSNGGVIALNLDDLVPQGHVVAEPNRAAGQSFLFGFNSAFVARNRVVLERAIETGKCDGFIISTTSPAVLQEEETSFNLCTATSLWHIGEADAVRVQRFRAFAQAQGDTSIW